MKTAMNRRAFLKGAAVSGIAAAALGLTACAPQTKMTSDASDLAKTGEAAGPSVPDTIAETVSVDLLIVGGGMSGLAAAVEAGDQGLSTLVIEATGELGGNGMGVEGLLGVGSSLQKEQNIEIEPAAVIRSELDYTHGRNDALRWMDLIQNSGQNVDWLVDHGVALSGQVDGYMEGGEYPTFHWFEGGFAKTGYINQMHDAAEAAGVQFRMNTKGTDLVFEDGVVKGAYAENEAGEALKIEAKAVILATGGFGGNPDYLVSRGYNPDDLFSFGAPNHDGDGFRMALSVGAGDRSQNFCALENFSFRGITSHDELFMWLNSIIATLYTPTVMWVNQNGERYVFEDCGAANYHATMTPSFNQEFTCCIFDRGIFEENVRVQCPYLDFGEGVAHLDEYVAEHEDTDIVVADTFEELASKAAQVFGLDEQTLLTNLNRYNELCKAGHDADFGKAAEFMKPFTNPPFYLGRLTQGVAVAIGGIHTSRNMEVLTEEDEPIPGLYSCGVDGVELYRNIYTINIGGSCNANNVNSGRIAVRNAKEYMA